LPRSVDGIYPEYARGILPRNDIQLGTKATVGWKNLSQTLARLAELDKNNIAAIIETVLRSGYEDYLKANFENFSERLEDLEQLQVFVSSYENLEKFLSDTALAEIFRSENRESDMGLSRQSEVAADEEIILSTIHQAKGLEWRAVFVIGLADGMFPHTKTYDKPEEMEEERRLFYVAVTRAKEQLYLTYPLFNQDNILHPSQFIKELPTKFYERWDLEEGAIDSDDDGEIKYVDEDEEYNNVKPAKRRMMDFDPRLDF
jgi:DNA helicase-2/ATP-dependent DNA helicase PcrA